LLSLYRVILQKEANMDRTICGGYSPYQPGTRGICRCGLYWEDTMPPHWEDGTPMTLERYEKVVKKEAELMENMIRRSRNRRELAAQAWLQVRVERP
jgi:hypothetical protein